MNINKLLLRLNLLAISSYLVFYICSKIFVPEYWGAYVNGFGFIPLVIFSAGPFVVNYLLLRTTPLPRQKMTSVSIFLISLLVAIDLFCLIIIYRDQFGNSRGFGLIMGLTIYSFVFLPLWVIFLIIFTIIKKRISHEHKIKN